MPCCVISVKHTNKTVSLKTQYKRKVSTTCRLCRLSSAHCEQINAFTEDCHGSSENAECECKDTKKICLLAVSGSSLKVKWCRWNCFSLRHVQNFSLLPYGLPIVARVFVYLCSFNIRRETFSAPSSVCYRGRSYFHIRFVQFLLPLIV